MGWGRVRRRHCSHAVTSLIWRTNSVAFCPQRRRYVHVTSKRTCWLLLVDDSIPWGRRGGGSGAGVTAGTALALNRGCESMSLDWEPSVYTWLSLARSDEMLVILDAAEQQVLSSRDKVPSRTPGLYQSSYTSEDLSYSSPSGPSSPYRPPKSPSLSSQ